MRVIFTTPSLTGGCVPVSFALFFFAFTYIIMSLSGVSGCLSLTLCNTSNSVAINATSLYNTRVHMQLHVILYYNSTTLYLCSWLDDFVYHGSDEDAVEKITQFSSVSAFCLQSLSTKYVSRPIFFSNFSCSAFFSAMCSGFALSAPTYMYRQQVYYCTSGILSFMSFILA